MSEFRQNWHLGQLGFSIILEKNANYHLIKNTNLSIFNDWGLIFTGKYELWPRNIFQFVQFFCEKPKVPPANLLWQIF